MTTGNMFTVKREREQQRRRPETEEDEKRTQAIRTNRRSDPAGDTSQYRCAHDCESRGRTSVSQDGGHRFP